MSKRLVALLGASLILAAACAPQASPSGPTGSPGATATATAGGAADQVLNLYLSSDDPPTLDPNIAQDNTSLTILRSITRPLLYFDKDLNIVDELAESHEISADAKTWTFHLRPDAKYSNGDPIVADDFVFGWKRTLDPRSAAPYAYVLCPIEGAEKLLGQDLGCARGVETTPSDDATIDAALKDVGLEAPDAQTFIVHLAVPATYFGAIAALWIADPVQEEWVNTPNFTEAENYVASGPFKIQSWAHNSEIVLVPNENWAGDVKPTLKEIHFHIGGDPAAALAAYEQGQYDMIDTTGAGTAEQIRVGEEHPDQVIDSPQLAITYYGYNNCDTKDNPACDAWKDSGLASAPTDNKNFRIALTRAVNKQTFIDLTFAGLGPPANTMVMPGLPGYSDYDPYPFDPAAATEAMTTALQELGVKDTDGDGAVTAADIPGRMKFGYNVDAGHLPRVAFLEEAWRTTLGFTEAQFDIVGTDFATFLQTRHAGEYDLSRNGWGADFPSAFNQLDGLFTCGGGNNDEQWCNKDFDALLQQAAVEQDQAAAATLYQDAQKILLDDAVALFLRFGVTRYLVQPYVQGYNSTPQNHIVPGDEFLETVSIAPH